MSSDSAKKRQTVDDGGAEFSMGGEGEDSLPRQMMSAMKQLLDQNRRMESKIDRMQEEMKGELKVIVSRLDDVDNRQKYHEILLKNQRWEYPLTIPTSTNTGEQTRFLVDIKTQTCNMRYGKCNGVVEIGGGDLTYETKFFPHWKEFANSLEEYQYALRCAPKDMYSTFLQLYNIHLPEEVLGLLSNALESTHFKKFRLGRNNFFGRSGIQFVLNYMQHNPVLEVLGLYGNHNLCFGSNDDIHRLCETIREHPTIMKSNWMDVVVTTLMGMICCVPS